MYVFDVCMYTCVVWCVHMCVDVLYVHYLNIYVCSVYVLSMFRFIHMQ